MELAAAQGLSGQDKVLHHVAVGYDVLGVLPALSDKEAGALPIVHDAVGVGGRRSDQNDAVSTLC